MRLIRRWISQYLLSITLVLILGFLARGFVREARAVEPDYPESISSFFTDLEVRQDRSLRIRETIKYQTKSSKHGIYRYIPIVYRVDGKTMRIYPRDIKITDENQVSLPYVSSRNGNNLTLKIGDKDKTFTGSKTYVISYIMDRAVQNDGDNARLYWDITGEGWQFPISLTTVSLVASAPTIKDVRCYSGELGGNDQACVVVDADPHQAKLSYAKEVGYGDNVTIDVHFAGTVGFSPQVETEPWWIRLIERGFLLLTIIPGVLGLFFWYRFGRDYIFADRNFYDQTKRKSILRPLFVRLRPPLIYEPLEISPGYAGTILKEHYGPTDCVADILDLARRKYLQIVQVQKKTLLKAADYEFTKLNCKEGGLPKHEQLLLASIFSTASKVKLSKLKGKFYMSLEKVKNQAQKQLYEDGILIKFHQKYLFVGIGLVLWLAVFVWYMASFNIYFSWMTIGSALVTGMASLVCVIMTTVNLTQKSGKGTNYKVQIRGLRETIQRGKWREEIKEKHLFIEEVLPFSVATGVVGKLSHDMQGLGLKPPSYISSGQMTSLATHSFVQQFSSDLGKGLAYHPSSSSWSGGGGSSGGGGGGGGGGSW